MPLVAVSYALSLVFLRASFSGPGWLFFLKFVSLLVPASCQSSPSCLQLLPGMTPAVLRAGSLVDGPLLVQLAHTVSGNHSSTSVCTVNIHTALLGRARGEPSSSVAHPLKNVHSEQPGTAHPLPPPQIVALDYLDSLNGWAVASSLRSRIPQGALFSASKIHCTLYKSLLLLSARCVLQLLRDSAAIVKYYSNDLEHPDVMCRSFNYIWMFTGLRDISLSWSHQERRGIFILKPQLFFFFKPTLNHTQCWKSIICFKCYSAYWSLSQELYEKMMLSSDLKLDHLGKHFLHEMKNCSASTREKSKRRFFFQSLLIHYTRRQEHLFQLRSIRSSLYILWVLLMFIHEKTWGKNVIGNTCWWDPFLLEKNWARA